MNVAEYKNLARKPNKYRAVRTQVGDITFASKLEANRYSELVLLVRSGDITNLELQPVYPIVWNGKAICKVIPDFFYIESQTGKLVAEDVKSKGTFTAVSRLKAKLLRAY